MLAQLKTNLLLSQQRMKIQADKHRSDRSFAIGDWVYLKLQPYKHNSLAQKAKNKLSPRFYGPFQVLQRVGEVAYELDLLPTACIYPVFHVSLLNPKLGPATLSIPTLPPMDQDGQLMLEPIAILQKRVKQLRNRDITEVLVHWQGLPADDATWDSIYQLHLKYPHLVGKVL